MSDELVVKETAQTRYLQTEKGKAAKARAQAKYLASERGRVARDRAAAAQGQARKAERSAVAFEREVLASRHRAGHIVVTLKGMTEQARAEWLERCERENAALRESIRRLGI